LGKILVTGGSGFVGSQTVKALSEQGHIVYIVDRKVQPWSYNYVPKSCIFETEFDIVPDVEFDTVMHFAADHVVNESVTDPAKYYDNNVVKTKRLLDTLVERNIKRFIFSSSASVYGKHGETSHLLGENLSTDPQCSYASTKAVVELMLRDYDTAYGLKSVSLRYFNAAGADPDGNFGYVQEPQSHLIPIICRNARLGTPLKVFGNDYDTRDGTCVRDYAHTCDIAAAHVKAFEYLANGGKSEILNVGAGIGTSILGVLKTFKETTGVDPVLIFADRRAGDPAALVADISKAKKILNWTPHYTLTDIIKHAWAWENRK
jgi:UDP-glucose 4-epimerase